MLTFSFRNPKQSCYGIPKDSVLITRDVCVWSVGPVRVFIHRAAPLLIILQRPCSNLIFSLDMWTWPSTVTQSSSSQVLCNHARSASLKIGETFCSIRNSSINATSSVNAMLWRWESFDPALALLQDLAQLYRATRHLLWYLPSTAYVEALWKLEVPAGSSQKKHFSFFRKDCSML